MIRPDPQPERIPDSTLQNLVEAVIDDPLGAETAAGLAALLASLPATEVRADRVRSHGRVSLGRSEAYRDGVVIALSEEIAERVTTDAHGWEDWAPHPRADNAATPDDRRDWARVEWEDQDDVSAALARVIEQAHNGDATLNSALDPCVSLLCRAAADRDDDTVEIRRGVRAEGRVRLSVADEGDAAAVVWIPDNVLARRRIGSAPTEQHLVDAYGEDGTPSSPHRARQRHETTDPDKL